MTDAPTLPPQLPARKGGGRRTGLIAGIAALVVVVLAVGGFAIARSGGNDTKTISVGVTDAAQPYWKILQDKAKAKGLTVKLVNFSDYTQANPALAQGQTDLNLFQHLVFLATYDQKNHQDLTPIASTYVVPLSLYSTKHTSVQQIPQGGRIAIPNDPTNQARALLVLQAAGLLKLNGGGTILATPADIDKAASKVSVVPVDASQTVTSLSSVDGSIVNNNFALDGHLDPSKALYGDNPRSAVAEPYINVIVARAKDKDNATYQEFVQLYRDPAVQKEIAAESKGTSVAVNRPAADLQSILARLEKTVQSS